MYFGLEIRKYFFITHIYLEFWPTYGPVHEISNNVVCATSKGSDQSICSSLAYSMSVKLLTEHLLEVLSLKGGCIGLYESTLVKMPLIKYCFV